MYEMDLRQYDAAIARWVAQDPVIHYDFSPYSAFDNNPAFWADPSGADAVKITDANGNTVGGSFDGKDKDDLYNYLVGNTDNFEAELRDFYSFESNKDQNGGGGGDPKIISLDRTGEKVLDAKSSFFGRLWATLEKREWRDPETGLTYQVDADGRVLGLAPVMIGSNGAINLIGGKGFIKITSSVKNNAKILKYAQETFKGNKALVKEANSLLREVSKGNMNPCIGTKEIGKGVFELRSKGGARVYFNNTKGGINILGYSHKQNQQVVIQSILNAL